MLYHIFANIWSVITIIMTNPPKRPKTDGVMMNFTSKSNNVFQINLQTAVFKVKNFKVVAGGTM